MPAMHVPALPPAARRPRSKAIAAWLALLVGTLGLHRIYLYGARDVAGWLHPLPTALGLIGVLRMRALGQDDRLAWLLIPLLGLMLVEASALAIVWALTPDETWNARHNPERPAAPSGWAAVFAAIAALMAGGIALVSTIAFTVQKIVEW
ncbi:MAG TPA: hypothetical protein PLZ50_08550 [Rubrivivax sp.]|nr:hypothetical protein [Rubrivivax sp.]